jgi:hypothetical protein
MDNELLEDGALPLDFFSHTADFWPGVNFITEGAERVLAESGEEALPFLCAHVAGNWGYVSQADGWRNDQAVKSGGRICSVYRTKTNRTLWVITEADRSKTTMMLPSES